MKTNLNVQSGRITKEKAAAVDERHALSHGLKKKRLGRRAEEAYALMLTMFMVAITLTLLIATLSRLTGDADLNARNGQYNASLYAAEAATERVIGRMRYDFLVGG